MANTKVTTPIDGFDQDSFDMGEGDEVPDLYDYFLKDMTPFYHMVFVRVWEKLSRLSALWLSARWNGNEVSFVDVRN